MVHRAHPLHRATPIVLVALVVAGCATVGHQRATSSTPAGAAGRRAGTTFASAGCGRTYGELTQSKRGRISGCMRIGPLDAGAHTVVLDGFVGYVNGRFKLPPRLPKRLRKLYYPKEPPVRLTVSPASGGPGTVVTVTGRLRRRPRRRGRDLVFCWDGCRFGPSLSPLSLHWLSRRVFRARLAVPAAPWIEGGPARWVPLASGSHPIGVQCIVLGKGCAFERAEGTADFYLHVSAAPAWCRTPSSCAQLHVSPAAAQPADVVRVTGFAPLLSVSAGAQPAPFELELRRGRPHGPEVVFSKRRGVVFGRFGHGALQVRPPPSFASLRHTAPIAEISAGLAAITGQPDAPSTVAWCAPGAIDVSRAGAVTTIPTSAAAATLTRMRVGLQSVGGSPPPECVALALAGPASDPAAVVAAAFPAAPAKYGSPFYEAALLTVDAGRTWKPLPVPPGASAAGFGGFHYRDGGVEAVFASSLSNPKAPSYPELNPGRPLAEVSSNGGSSWQPAPLGCPAAGPCLTLGPYLPDNCAKLLGMQPLLRSTDGGVRWSQPPLIYQLNACGEAELVATSARTALLVSSMSAFPVVRTTNGGTHWADVGVPPIPGERRQQGLGLGPGGITVLPNGSLLLSGGAGYRGGWLLLRHRRRAWCQVRTPGRSVQRAPQLTPLTVIGSELWWLTGAYGATPAVHQLAASAVSC